MNRSSSDAIKRRSLCRSDRAFGARVRRLIHSQAFPVECAHLAAGLQCEAMKCPLVTRKHPIGKRHDSRHAQDPIRLLH
jgi:hypothetical protein